MKIFEAVLLLASIAAATPSPQIIATCSSGTLECCDSMAASDSNAALQVLEELGETLESVLQVGLSCASTSVNSLQSRISGFKIADG